MVSLDCESSILPLSHHAPQSVLCLVICPNGCSSKNFAVTKKKVSATVMAYVSGTLQTLKTSSFSKCFCQEQGWHLGLEK